MLLFLTYLERGTSDACGQADIYLLFVCWYVGCHFVFIPNIFGNMIHNCSDKVTVSTPTYRRICKFNMFLHFTVVLAIYFNTLFIYSLIMSNDKCLILATRRIEHGPYRRLLPGTSAKSNAQFTPLILRTLLCTTFTTWLVILLLCSGDVHPNPGPPASTYSTNDTSATTTISATIFDLLPLNHNLSFVHYNVQSIYTKLEILQAELIEFDILAFSETWLNRSVDTEDLILGSYQSPERKDREGDDHGGVIIYVKEGIYYKRRNDLEIQGLEAVWIEVASTRKHILFDLFYRPPNSNAHNYSMIEDSLFLAVDTNISDIIVTGD